MSESKTILDQVIAQSMQEALNSDIAVRSQRTSRFKLAMVVVLLVGLVLGSVAALLKHSFDKSSTQIENKK